jgi:hypothetical protein
MAEMVDSRRNAETKEEHYDLFSGLLDAAQGDLDGAAVITEQELIGKCYHIVHWHEGSHSPYREYVHFPSRWTRGSYAPFPMSRNLNRPSGTDDGPHTLLRIRRTSPFPRCARTPISANQGYNGRPGWDACRTYHVRSQKTDELSSLADLRRHEPVHSLPGVSSLLAY